MKPTPIAAPLERMLDAIFAAELPVLLSGSHGIGKSQFLESYAQSRGWVAHVLDLSLLEATDLTGLPYRDGGVTRFAPPATLPMAGGPPALLILEELNRCDRSVRQPCLQLLTTRRLNDYHLPADCRLASCINPVDGGYEVDALDPALASRFVVLPVVPDREAWVRWAQKRGLFSGIVKFVERFPQAFERAPPRTWTYAAALSSAALRQGWSMSELEMLLEPLLQSLTAKALVMELHGMVPDIPPEKLVRMPSHYLPQIQAWTREGRLDLIAFTLDDLARWLKAHPRSPVRRGTLAPLLAVVPPDLAAPIDALLVP